MVFFKLRGNQESFELRIDGEREVITSFAVEQGG